MRVIVNSNIRLKNVPEELKRNIQRQLTIKNPQFDKKAAMGLPTWGVQREIKLYSIFDDEIVIPRGFLVHLQSHINQFKNNYGALDLQAADGRLTLPKIKYNSKITLRDYQSPAIEAAKKYRSGVIIMPCGAGKTETGLQVVSELGQPTLWITHTKDLLTQSLERAKSKLNLKEGEYGVIGGGECSIGSHITFAMVQTLSNRNLDDIKDKFGCIVIDEAHHCFKDDKAIGQFYSVISTFPAVHRLGLTASEHRSDGLIETMFLTIGPKIYEVTQETLNATGNIVVPEVQYIETSFQYEKDEEERINFAQLLKAIAQDDVRNDLIIETIRKNVCGNYGLVLGDSLDHLEYLWINFHDKSIRAEFINGSTPKDKRRYILEQMRAKKIDLLFATYQLAKEGLDVPCLNRLYLVTPKKDKVVVQQSVGRIMRPADNKADAKVFDFYDSNITTCIYHAKERNKIYKSLNCSITGGPVRRKKDV